MRTAGAASWPSCCAPRRWWTWTAGRVFRASRCARVPYSKPFAAPRRVEVPRESLLRVAPRPRPGRQRARIRDVRVRGGEGPLVTGLRRPLGAHRGAAPAARGTADSRPDDVRLGHRLLEPLSALPQG